ncbi:Hypp5941 [Branchiostoma lanceolatum]|uniref:Hypp5941 protein n=1 Tax=Branchiostoma lanceolatum TaxID=7740 RepID=A0A8J9YSM0_BRALA|nr:Hypp5941 [Branchiostoma lanceolatum]
MADEDTAEKPSDSAPDDTKEPPVQAVQEEEVGESKGRRADSIQVDTIDGPTQFAGGSGEKPSECCAQCGGCPVLIVIVLGILVGNAFGMLLIYQRFYAVKGSPVKQPPIKDLLAPIKASLPPSLAPPANQRRRSISEGSPQEVDRPKMTSLHLREDGERPNRIRRMPMEADSEIGITPFLVAKRKKLETVEDAKRLQLKMDKKTTKISKFQSRKENALHVP